MAKKTKLFWVDEDTGDTITLVFDTTTSEDPEDALQITEHPVEQGADISDNAREEPERVTVEGYITNTPHQGNLNADDDNAVGPLALKPRIMGDRVSDSIQLDVPDPPLQISESGLLQAGVQAIGNLITGGPNRTASVLDLGAPKVLNVTAQALQSASGRNRARDAYEKLRAAQSARALVTVQLDLRDYFDMLIERIAKPRKQGDGSAYLFTLDLRRIVIAESQTVQSPKPAEARGTATANRGSQAAKDDPNADAKDQVRASLAVQAGLDPW